MTHRGPFQPRTFCDSVTESQPTKLLITAYVHRYTKRGTYTHIYTTPLDG